MRGTRAHLGQFFENNINECRNENSVLAQRDPNARARRSFVTGKCYCVTTFIFLMISHFFLKQPLQAIVRNLGEDRFGACSRIGTWREKLDCDRLKKLRFVPNQKTKCAWRKLTTRKSYEFCTTVSGVQQLWGYSPSARRVPKPSACQLQKHTTIPSNMIGSMCQLRDFRSIRARYFTVTLLLRTA